MLDGGKYLSENFTVLNGTCQGNAFSPILFNVINAQLPKVNEGCVEHLTFIGSLIKADDKVLLCHSTR